MGAERRSVEIIIVPYWEIGRGARSLLVKWAPAFRGQVPASARKQNLREILSVVKCPQAVL